MKRHPKAEMTLPAMAKRIEMWLIERLIPWVKNPRTHSDAQLTQIAASIAEFGFNNPILVDTKSGIIAGHGRLLAARKLGLKEVPVIVLDHLSEPQKRAYIIADNQLALNAGWDEELLRQELATLQNEDFNLDLIGFDDEDLARLLAEQDAAQGSHGRRCHAGATADTRVYDGRSLDPRDPQAARWRCNDAGRCGSADGRRSSRLSVQRFAL